MKRNKHWFVMAVLVLLLSWSGMSLAVSPPGRINFQGVLRDAAGAPTADGIYEMVFRFFGNGAGACDCGEAHGRAGCTDATCQTDVCAIDPFCCVVTWNAVCAAEAEQFASCQVCIADEEVLIDNHTAASLFPAVAVTGGLFNVALGSGGLADGSGAGTYFSLGAVFRDFDVVYVEPQVNGEVLSPRIRVEGSAYTQNALQLEGKRAAEFLDLSANPQTKAGDLAVNDLTLNGNGLFFGEGAKALSTASGLSVFAGESASDGLKLFAGPSIGHGSVDIRGDGALILRAGNGFISFGEDGGVESAALDPAGNLQIDGSLTAMSGDFTSDVQVGGDLVFADGSIQTSAVSSLPPDTCFDNVGRYVVCGNGTVKDNLTGLFWLEDAGCSISDWAAANVTAAQLADGQCGLTDGSSPGDWRLPTQAEWQVIVDQAVANGCSAPYVPDTGGLSCWSEGDPFSDVNLTVYWSSTTRDISPSLAWTANLFQGNFGNNLKTVNFRVWPVRAGP